MLEQATSAIAQKPSVLPIERETVTIRFAGDSGDGMQLTGSQLTSTSAIAGNDVQTFADFPAEIRAPAGTLPGVSGFQLSFSNHDIYTVGDRLDVLVAMNPAALKVNLADLELGGILLVNVDNFTEKDLKKANYAHNPLESGELAKYQVIPLGITELTLNAVKGEGISHSQGTKCKNMFALGVVCWLYSRPLDATKNWLMKKFNHAPAIAKANELALQAGFNFALTTELFAERYIIKKASLAPGYYRQITGNEAFALACAAIAAKTGAPLLLSGYPITPASAILHQVSKYEHLGIKTFQAEDEIAAICACVGAAFGGGLAMTTTSGPGLDLKAEGLGLAVMTELPLVVIDVQRAGPSTGMPTKTEQGDLLAAIHGRHGECPIPVLAPCSPADCFNILIEAFQIATKYMTPVIILSDGYMATGAEPWLIPEVKDIPDLSIQYQGKTLDEFNPYRRDPKTLSRPWAVPGTPGLEHRLGGLEKDQSTGNISYDPINHEKMVTLRYEKVKGTARDIAPTVIHGANHGKVLVVGWGSTYGTILTAVESLQQQGHPVSFIHLRHLFPFPNDLGGILKEYEAVLIPELNLGQLNQLVRAEYLINTVSYSKVTGKPFLIDEIRQRILELL